MATAAVQRGPVAFPSTSRVRCRPYSESRHVWLDDSRFRLRREGSRLSGAVCRTSGPRRHPHPRQHPVLELQRTIGNRRVAALIGKSLLTSASRVVQRDAPKGSKPKRPRRSRETRPLWRDVRTAPLEEIERELTAVQDELFTTSTKTQRGKELFASMQMLKKEIARRHRLPRIVDVRRDLDGLAERQERVLDAARFTYKMANDHFLGPFERDMNGYVERFQKAYNNVEARLRKAQADEERLYKIRDALMGVAIGTGVGLAAGAIWKSAEGFKRIAIEVGGEITEWLLGQGYAQIAPEASKWQLPPTISRRRRRSCRPRSSSTHGRGSP